MTEGAQPTPTPEQPVAPRRRAALGWWVLGAFGLLAGLALVLGQLFHGPAAGQASAGSPTTPPTTSHAGGQTPSFSGTATPTGTPTGTPTASPTTTGAGSSTRSAGTGPVGSGSSGTGPRATASGSTTSRPSAPSTTRTSTPPPGGGPTITPSGPATGSPFTITVSGVDGPLVPGAPRTLTVQVHNPNSSTIRLLSLTASVGDPQHAGCSAAWVSVGSYAAAHAPLLLVGAGQSRPLSLPIVLTNLATVNQDGCKGVSFPLTFNGSATQVTP
ncbi:hypothetical protein [Angustibacter luteus]|uniref:Uncharacterized protein n=1 Tax=Angustibacter luteus TaxID=658456 RepID=A0ABW1J8W9_9ACTN